MTARNRDSTLTGVARTLSSQTLSLADRRIAAAWAADCAEHVLPLFEAEVPDDDRPRDAIVRTRRFASAELAAGEAIRSRFVAGRAARSAVSGAAAAAARATGQASGVAHMGAHALGAAAYAAYAVALSRPDRPGAREAEISWQLQRLSPEAAAVLRALPAVGVDTSGPLGPGLLSSGAVGEIIRELQSQLSTR